MTKNRLRVIPLGGLGEIGKNMMALEFADDIMVIDAGLMFPEEDMPGVDYVIPDFSYLAERKDRVRGIVVTHGHEDHTGALPYLLPQVPAPIYATRLTQGLINAKLKESRTLSHTTLNEVETGSRFRLGTSFEVEMFPVCHSIPDAAGLIIRTPVGTIIHSGDFKLDYTPVGGRKTDLTRLAQVGAEGVLLLFSDSTYVELPGQTPSEITIGQTLERIIREAPGRVIVTTFSSLISRIQLVIAAAKKLGRKVCIVGHSMKETVRIANDLGYIDIPEGVLINLGDLKNFPPDNIVLVMTGSQGEPTSALVRIANRDNPNVSITPGDTVVMSATPVPGNEALVNRTIDSLFRQGARVVYEKIAPVHVHGHGSQEELKLLISLVRPTFFVPVHGEYRHMSLHAGLARDLGMPPENVFVLEDGDILELDSGSARKDGKVSAGNVYVDGVVMGDLAQVVLRDRRALARDGIVVAIVPVDKEERKLAGRPDIVARGFLEAKGEEDIIEGARDVVAAEFDNGGGRMLEAGLVNSKVRDSLSRFFYEKTKRRPMIVPVTIEV
jgi:ribonuclease J